jgi:flagellar protein FliO/FliZ
MIVGMAVVLGILAALAWWLKRFGPARPGASGAARIVGGISVGARERVIVVEVADQWIVVGVAPGSVNALTTMPRQELPPVATAPNAGAQLPASFAGWLKHTMDKRNANK